MTASTSATDFEVNGKHVLCDGHTEFGYTNPGDAKTFAWTGKPYLGEPLQVYGREDRQTHVIHAKRVVFAPEGKPLYSQGIIDRMLAPQLGGALLVRADGYPILLTSATQITFAEPLKDLKDVHTNEWLEYQGNQRPDGVLVAAKAMLRPNFVNQREQRLQEKYQYDPSAVPTTTHQNSASRYLIGADPKLIPPSTDMSMQRRIDSIGQKLVPAYQRSLADDDPTKIRFRFQVVDEKYAKDKISLPNGTLLIPRMALDRLKDDDLVAAYLADGIAAILEKQEIRDAVRKRLMQAATIGSYGTLPTFALASAYADPQKIETAEMEQRIRVSLALVHDAGYNITEAPKAWWLLSAAKQEPLAEIPIPESAIYAYAVLGSTWRDTAWDIPMP